MKSCRFIEALAFVLFLSVATPVRAELTSFEVGPDSPNYGALLEFAQSVHPDDFGLGARTGSATAVRYELKFRKKRHETWPQFAERLTGLKAATERAYPGQVVARDELGLKDGELAVTATDVFPKLSLVVFVDPKTGYLVTADRLAEIEKSSAGTFARTELGILPRTRAYGIETPGRVGSGVRLSDPSFVWVDLKGKRHSDPWIVDKPRAAFATQDWAHVRFGSSAPRAKEAVILLQSRELSGPSGEGEAALQGFRLIQKEYRRQTGRAYAPEEGYLARRTAWVVKGTPIQATQDRAYRRTEPLLEEGLRAGDLSRELFPHVIAEFAEPIFAEFKFTPGENDSGRAFKKLLKQNGFDLRLKSITQGKRRYSKGELARRR
jgi:hypothetical protein